MLKPKQKDYHLEIDEIKKGIDYGFVAYADLDGDGIKDKIKVSEKTYFDLPYPGKNNDLVRDFTRVSKIQVSVLYSSDKSFLKRPKTYEMSFKDQFRLSFNQFYNDTNITIPQTFHRLFLVDNEDGSQPHLELSARFYTISHFSNDSDLPVMMVRTDNRIENIQEAKSINSFV